MQESLIPLFPLEVVLFPGQPLPLHIFEERYKIMIRECLATEGPREFGVVLAKPDGIANVGCTAEVVEVVRSYADGRMDIVTAGRRRFEVLFVDESKEYLRAAAEFFHDEESPAPDALRDHVVELHRQLVPLLSSEGQEPEAPDAKAGPAPLSFRLAGPLPLELDFKQSLLALRSENQRLEQLAQSLPRLLSQLRRADRVRTKSRGNGHCQ